MNGSSRILILCLAGVLSCAGCHRQEPPPEETVEAAPPVRQARPKLKRLDRALSTATNEAGTIAQPSTQGPKDIFVPAPKEDASVAYGPPKGQGTPIQVRPSSRPEPPAQKLVQTKNPSGTSGGKQSKRQEADAIFDQPTLLRVQIQIPPAGLSVLRQTSWGNGKDRPVAKAVVREGGLVYTNVAVHLKGAAGSFRSVDDRPALTLNFDKFAPEQSFHGLHKISLNNSVQDSTFLSEKIARELFLAAGVPVPRASHALVELNGRSLGMYVLLEGANKQFLKRFFNDAKGNLYDGGFCRDIGSRLSVNCGEDPNNHTGLRALRTAARSSNFAMLEKALDVDRFCAMLAMEMMLCHWDGYSFNRNNWRVFHDLEANRMVFIPHGLDQLFGGGPQFDPNGPILPLQVQGDVSRAVLATREGQRRYLEKVKEIYTSVFRPEDIYARVDQVAAGVASALAKTDPQAAKSFLQRANAFKHRVGRRAAALRQQLGAPVQPQEFNSNGILPLAGWTKSLLLSGEPILEETEEEGRKLLGISAGESASSSSWRTHVPLGPGKYRFEGRVRLKGVTVAEGDERAGAALRVSKGPNPKKLSGTSDWSDFKYNFDVGAKGADVEFVCELKATAGEVWFDTSSLRVVRLQ